MALLTELREPVVRELQSASAFGTRIATDWGFAPPISTLTGATFSDFVGHIHVRLNCCVLELGSRLGYYACVSPN